MDWCRGGFCRRGVIFEGPRLWIEGHWARGLSLKRDLIDLLKWNVFRRRATLPAKVASPSPIDASSAVSVRHQRQVPGLAIPKQPKIPLLHEYASEYQERHKCCENPNACEVTNLAVAAQHPSTLPGRRHLLLGGAGTQVVRNRHHQAIERRTNAHT